MILSYYPEMLEIPLVLDALFTPAKGGYVTEQILITFSKNVDRVPKNRRLNNSDSIKTLIF